MDVIHALESLGWVCEPVSDVDPEYGCTSPDGKRSIISIESID